MLFPTNIVAINWLGLAKNMDRMEVENLFFDLSTSKRSLLAVINAISIPEKKAENKIAIRMEMLNSTGLTIKVGLKKCFLLLY